MANDQKPEIQISESDLYAFANCIWWVMQEGSLPKGQEKIQSKWEEEADDWALKARKIMRHLDYNGFNMERIKPQEAANP
ncbi:hypothetical protein RDV64_23695 (plasmid) [Acuticoccus sp. MNP-M23]|uniref:hypothetical protein n=1 Tax=Acuticoccus sp. MNP-M23 TaxID=3072793 RepID=UPI002815CCF7|nr:hypothetical protein [Acuticoccus sp. MNP-M23]WMS45359.1 hypothetical protein RDV64_23695 [Acuticoccus sp. MNP-M23]